MKQRTLEGEWVNPPPDRRAPNGPRKLAAMVAIYGAAPDGVQCKKCVHFWRVKRHTKVYRKCLLYGDTRGPGTDWLASWSGCGKYDDD